MAKLSTPYIIMLISTTAFGAELSSTNGKYVEYSTTVQGRAYYQVMVPAGRDASLCHWWLDGVDHACQNQGKINSGFYVDADTAVVRIRGERSTDDFPIYLQMGYDSTHVSSLVYSMNIASAQTCSVKYQPTISLTTAQGAEDINTRLIYEGSGGTVTIEPSKLEDGYGILTNGTDKLRYYVVVDGVGPRSNEGVWTLPATKDWNIVVKSPLTNVQPDVYSGVLTATLSCL